MKTRYASRHFRRCYLQEAELMLTNTRDGSVGLLSKLNNKIK